MPNKLTDAEVKKALEWHLNEVNHCDGCPLFVLKNTTTYCVDVLMQNALDLINRQDQEKESLKAEVERLKKVEERHMRLYHLLLDPVIVANGKNGELRPIKRTSRQDVYHTLLRAQEIMKIPHRWFPWKRDGDNK